MLTDGLRVGLCEIVGESVGSGVGIVVGCGVGLSVCTVGRMVGLKLPLTSCTVSAVTSNTKISSVSVIVIFDSK